MVETWRWVNMFLGALGTGVCLFWYVMGRRSFRLQGRLGFLSLTLWCISLGYGSFEAQYLPHSFVRLPVATAAVLFTIAAAVVPRYLQKRDGKPRI